MDIIKKEEENMEDKPEVLLVDLGKVLLFSKEKLPGKMNPRHKELLEESGDDYPFFDYFDINEELLGLLASLKDKYRIHMITEGVIQSHPQLREKLESAFDYENIISTGGLDLDKKKPRAYRYVVKRLEINPGKILFIDDSSDNINAASKVGLQVIQYTSKDQAISDLKKKLDLE